MAARRQSSNWAQNVTTPLGFYVLSLLIIESTLAFVLKFAEFGAEQRWNGFLWMIGIFCGLVLVVTAFAVWIPKNLLFGKEEHHAPQISPSALRDQIEDLIHAKVRDECLKN